ncbi:unnamed protein product [Orchesella dallaii]|uniref:Uncharacterized protein n=1 Tax=Orchesella dallaii TaxID=48710 RepID=A0ABP1QBU4_9HEXA
MAPIDKGIFILVMLFSVILTINCLSFKEKLTAYAEKSEDTRIKTNEVKIRLESDTLRPVVNCQNIAGSNTKGCKQGQFERTRTNYSPITTYGKPLTSVTSDRNKTLSLWEITKHILLPFQNNIRNEPISNPNLKGDSQKSYGENSLQNGTKVASKQPLKDFLMTVKTEFDEAMKKGIGKGASRNSNATENYVNSEIQQQQEQQRSKKDVGGSGIRDVLWHTAKALWSVNKEHFLPTFLHTKTGGKLSLIRDSIFKPIAILSQYKSGVREINNEKWKSLSRLTSFGSGWGNPKSQLVVVKYLPKTPFFTLARYIFRLSKHTVITKWRLRRALLDLQIRALKKLLRIISNKNISQKIAIIKILTNAVWKGKRAFLRIVTGNKHSSPSEGTTYEGKDNAFNVDITYGSLSKPVGGGSDDGWRINNFQPNVRDTFTPPPPNPYSYYPSYSNPAPSPLYAVPDPLIQSPSYARAIKTIGVHPSNYQYQSDDDRSRDVVGALPSPTPTVVYFAENTSPDPEKHVTNDKNSVIEKPTSYSYHYSGPQQDSSPSTYLPYLSKGPHESSLYPHSNRESKSGTTTPSPFRLKLLEYMSAPTTL